MPSPIVRKTKVQDLIIYCDRPSNAARELSSRLNCRRLYRAPNKRVVSTRGALVINYGTSLNPAWGGNNPFLWLNPPSLLSGALSKVESYECFLEADLPTFQFTTDHKQAIEWNRTGGRVLARREGLSGGKGISIFEPGDTSIGQHASDFYTRYYPKTHEYRVHVFRNESLSSVDEGGVIDITQKKRVHGSDGETLDRTLYQRVVRSHGNGWVHAHQDLHLPNGTRDVFGNAAIRAVSALGLDFGAVDILAKFSKKTPSKLESFVVCEVNTAPGLENEATIEAYKTAILKVYNETKADRKLRGAK